MAEPGQGFRSSLNFDTLQPGDGISPRLWDCGRDCGDVAEIVEVMAELVGL